MKRAATRTTCEGGGGAVREHRRRGSYAGGSAVMTMKAWATAPYADRHALARGVVATALARSTTTAAPVGAALLRAAMAALERETAA